MSRHIHVCVIRQRSRTCEMRRKPRSRNAPRNWRHSSDDVLLGFSEAKARREQRGAVLSTPDKAVFFGAYALGYGIITDEGPMSLLCKEFNVEHLPSLLVCLSTFTLPDL